MDDDLLPFASGWPPVPPHRRVELVLDGQGGEDRPIGDLSAAAIAGRTLFLGSDEGLSIELVAAGGKEWGDHRRLPLGGCLRLSDGDEADIEGLAEDDGWLWVLGSHARTRPKIAPGPDERIALEKFSELKDTRSRCLVASIPLLACSERQGAMVPVACDGERRAGLLRQTKRGNALARHLRRSSLFRPFTRVPAKEGGIDLEGIAVAGQRVAIGMRGPVLHTFAVLLEFTFRRKGSGRLKIAGPLFTRLLALEGLGIRDLKRLGDDLLILAGPTTGLDGPCAVYRWRGWLHDPPNDEELVRLHRPERIIELPFGRGNDHPEGLAVLDAPDGKRLLVVCDTPAPARIDPGRHSIACDLFDLPA